MSLVAGAHRGGKSLRGSAFVFFIFGALPFAFVERQKKRCCVLFLFNFSARVEFHTRNDLFARLDTPDGATAPTLRLEFFLLQPFFFFFFETCGRSQLCERAKVLPSQHWL